MTFLYFFAIALFLILCATLCFVVLIQESKSTGLGASFGGDTTDSLFGTSTADVLKKFTAWMAAIFLIACVILSMWTASMARTRTSSSADSTMIEGGIE
jgi:preprotein translocase subunit SecG